MLNTKQKKIIADKLQCYLRRYALARGNYFGDDKTPIQELNNILNREYRSVFHLVGLVKDLIQAESKTLINPNIPDVFEYLGLNYEKDFIQYVNRVEECIVEKCGEARGNTEEEIPF